jgi:homoserine acetyltransferase
MMKALAQIKAPALLLPSMSDRTIPGYLTRELYRGLRGKVVYAEIPSIRGHGAGVNLTCKNRSKPAPDFGRKRQVISVESGR